VRAGFGSEERRGSSRITLSTAKAAAAAAAPGLSPLTPTLPKPTHRFESYFGRKIAVDASMHIYQFLIVVGRQVRCGGMADG